MATRRRLDRELVHRGLAVDCAEAQQLIEQHRVLVRGAIAQKATRQVAATDPVVVAAPPPRFVGRGAQKLDHALDEFGIDVTACRALDAGASTGGFTDCLLQRGAARVVALDVGHGQLHERLLADPRVLNLERTNVRTTTLAPIGGAVDIVVADLSFISLALVVPVLVRLCHPGSPMILLVKPQFEATRAEAARGKGVIDDPEVHHRVRGQIERALTDSGCVIHGWTTSPITGADGNREFLVHAVTPS